MNCIDTRPGATGNNPFTPPSTFTGNGNEYLALITQRYQSIDRGQHMICIVRRLMQPNAYQLTFAGPFQAEARSVIKQLKREFIRPKAAA